MDPSEHGRRVAIIGAGVSGLVAAHLLRRRHEVTVFEAADRIGGHTHTIDVETDDGVVAVDTGFIVYNERNYPLFTRLMKDLGVETQSSEMSFSVQCERSGLEYNGSSLNQLFTQRRRTCSPRFLRMVRDILRFNREADRLDGSSKDDVTVEEFVGRHRFSDAFLEWYLTPIGASIWSCPDGAFRRFPIRFVIQFLRNHGMLQLADRPEWRVIRGGSARYVEALTAPYRDRIHVGSPVGRVHRSADSVDLEIIGQGRRTFDHVVFACHSDQALRMLASPTSLERETLGSIPYERNDTVLHTDASLLPSHRRAWGAWNHRIRRDPGAGVAITYNMNILQSLGTDATYCVTLNESDRVDPSCVVRSMSYEHPVFSSLRNGAQRRHKDLIGVNRTSYCGAYWGYGFHEDGVRSATDVASRFGCVH